MERRGAAEVVAIDVEDHLLWDWPPDYSGVDQSRDPVFTGPPKGAGFRLVHDLIGSKADWRPERKASTPTANLGGSAKARTIAL